MATSKMSSKVRVKRASKAKEMFLDISRQGAEMKTRGKSYFVNGWMAFAATIITLTVLQQPSMAQTTSAIEGTVTDKQGLAVGSAQVHAEGVSIGADRSAMTDATGAYRLTALPAGTYKLTV